MSESNNNGLDPKIWGPNTWKHIESVAFGYSDNPTDKEKKVYKQYFKNLAYVLPCCGCRKSYKEFITSEPNLKLTDTVLKNRENLTKWVYELHQRVNKKLGHNYNFSYNDFCRSMCIKYDIELPFEKKMNSSCPPDKKGYSYVGKKDGVCYYKLDDI